MGTYARNILHYIDTLTYIEPYVLPSGLRIKSLYDQTKTECIVPYDNHFAIYPNPAMSYFVADYKTDELGNTNSILRISDLTGTLVKQFYLRGTIGNMVISTKDLKPGAYLCSFVVSGKLKKTIKLAIVK